MSQLWGSSPHAIHSLSFVGPGREAIVTIVAAHTFNETIMISVSPSSPLFS